MKNKMRMHVRQCLDLGWEKLKPKPGETIHRCADGLCHFRTGQDWTGTGTARLPASFTDWCNIQAADSPKRVYI